MCVVIFFEQIKTVQIYDFLLLKKKRSRNSHELIMKIDGCIFIHETIGIM